MSLVEVTPLQNGTELGDEFEITKTLGAGGFGITYLVRALKSLDDRITAGQLYVVKEFAMRGFVQRLENSHRLVAVGENDDHITHNANIFEASLKKFNIEARNLAKFQHPNIVEVLLIRQANGTAYIIMEYVSGQSLHARLIEHLNAHQIGVTWPHLQPILFQLIEALDTIHQRRIIHRDIKPNNVMLRGSGDAVLIDFGGARATERARQSMILTPGFAPAEQWQAARPLDHVSPVLTEVGPPTDIYATAASIYQAMTGQIPHQTNDQGEVVGVNHPLLGHPMQDALQLPAPAARAIDWALNYDDPTMRPQSAIEWRRGLLSTSDTRPASGGVPAAETGPNSLPPQASGTNGPTGSKSASSRQMAPTGIAQAATTVMNPVEVKKSRLATSFGLVMAGLAAVVAVTVLGLLMFTDVFSYDRRIEYAAQIRVDENWTNIADAIAQTGQPLTGHADISSPAGMNLRDLTRDGTSATIAVTASDPIRIRFRDGEIVRVIQIEDETEFPKLSSGELANLEVRAVTGAAKLILANAVYAEAKME